MRFSKKVVLFASAIFVVLFAAACGGAAPSGTGGGTGGGGDAAGAVDAAKGFFNAVFTGGDVNAFLCKSNEETAKAISQGMESMKSALAASGATIDTSGLTFESVSASGDTAQVKVGGNLKTTVGGVSQDTPYTGATITLKNESGSWKVCG